jgi:hypothetical protein
VLGGSRNASGPCHPEPGRLWRLVYVGCAVAALYLNVLVLIVQGFLKVPFLHDMAPTHSDPPFAVTQIIVLLIFIALGILAAIRFRLEEVATT